jgi:hypothetical protein
MPIGGETRYDNFGAGNAVDDLARADMEDIFIQTRTIRDYLGRFPGYPFVVGPKGAGKSLVLFKRLMHVRALSGVLVLPRHPLKAFTPGLDFGGNSHWSEFWQLWDDDRPRLDAWGTLWEWALLRTILGAWLAHARRHATDVVLVDELDELTDGTEDADPFDLVSDYLQLAASGQKMTRGRFVLPADTGKLRRFMASHCAAFPPTYVFMDNHDDSFEEDPHFWKASCLGVFRAVRSLHERSNRRIHCHLTVRPEVIQDLKRSEHFPRWAPDICHLAWEDAKLIELFSARAARLKPELVRSPALLAASPLAALLGDGLLDPDGELRVRNLRVEDGEPLFEGLGATSFATPCAAPGT